MKLTDDQIDKLCARLVPLHPMCNPDDVSWTWLRDWTGWRKKAGLNAAYLALTNSIGIPLYRDNMLLDDIMLPSYCHELCHAAQRRRLGFFAYIMKKGLARRLLEAEAVIEEKRVQALLKVHVL